MRRREQERRLRFKRIFGLFATALPLYLAGLALLVTTSCATATAMPYAACLYDQQRRYDTGRVIARRDADDALLFQFNDSTKGDHGFQWVTPGGTRSIRPCREATLMDQDDPMRDRDPFAPRPIVIEQVTL